MPSGRDQGRTGLIPIDADAGRRQPGTTNTATAETGSTTMTGRPAARQLRRSADDKKLAGVAGGIARYLDQVFASQAERGRGDGSAWCRQLVR